MQFNRFFSQPNIPVQDQVQWTTSDSSIKHADGRVVFEMKGVEHPLGWSQNAVDILAQKYFRKRGVPPAHATARFDDGFNMPEWLQRTIVIPGFEDEAKDFGSETSAKQTFHRLAGAWTYWAWREGIFRNPSQPEIEWAEQAEASARIFYDELYLMLARQMFAPNSPQWFNTGLHWAYGIAGSASGQWAIDDQGVAYETDSAYANPQPHACFIQPITDDLVNPGGIMDLWVREVRLFKQGSGTGTNFSNIRGKNERLSGGGVSSGLMSFLEIGDASAKSIKSGGVTRRAAKMCVLDADHPEILDFISWKAREEYKAACMYLGSNMIQEADEKGILPQAIKDRIIRGGFDLPAFGLGWQDEPVTSVSGQNSNNSVRIPDRFLRAVEAGEPWELKGRVDKRVNQTIAADIIWQNLCKAAWACGDPGVQFDDLINDWHTCKADGRINASNPCSEYLHLDNTACNLASLNLCAFLVQPLDNALNLQALHQATRLATVVLEVSVFMASFPSREIALGSYNYRTLGLGYANLGGLLMRKGLPYDSDLARNLAAALTAFIHGQSYLTSIEMGKELGPFPRWEANRLSCDEVLDMHIDASRTLLISDPDLARAVFLTYSKLAKEVEAGHGPRNAQVTNIAPTGTISFAMDCDTTGIECFMQLISFKSLAGGGDMVLGMDNESVSVGLKTLGYTQAQIKLIQQHIKEYGTIEGWAVNGQPMPEEHLKVFDCANPGRGTRFISYLGHLKMVGAVQPFISGGISKTINLPNSATIEDVSQAYLEARKLGVKSVALFRDGCKLDQPLKAQASKPELLITGNVKFFELEDQAAEATKAEDDLSDLVPSEQTILRWKNGPNSLLIRGERHRLPSIRDSQTQDIYIDGHHLYVITGHYPDGSLGEIFLELSKEGSTVRALLNSLAKSISIGIQYGVPLDRYVRSFVYTKFEPSGIVEGHSQIKLASSILDFVFRHLAIKYLGQTEYANLELERANEVVEEKQLQSTLPRQIAQPTAILLEECPNCHQPKLVRTGTCTFCTNCHENSGCG